MLHILYVLSDWSHADQQWCKESSDAFINEFLLKHKAENWDTINKKKSVDQLWPFFWVTQQELEYFLYSSGNLEPQSQSKLLTLLERAGNSYKLNRALKIINELINIYMYVNSSSIWKKKYSIQKQMYALACHPSLGENQIEDNNSGKWKGCPAWLGKW